MTGRKTPHPNVHTDGQATKPSPVARILGSVRGRLRTLFPEASEQELDGFMGRVLYYGRAARRKQEREVKHPASREPRPRRAD